MKGLARIYLLLGRCCMLRNNEDQSGQDFIVAHFSLELQKQEYRKCDNN